LFVCLCR